MKTILLLTTIMYGCATSPEPDLQRKAEAAIGQPNLRWMVGTWNCIGFYRAVPPLPQLHGHKTTGVYSITADVLGNLTGSYKDNSGGLVQPVDYTEVWEFGAQQGNRAPAHIRTSVPGLLVGDANGEVDGPLDNTTIFGDTTFLGTATLPDGSTAEWQTLMFGDIALATGVREISVNSRIGTSTVLFQYLDMTCTPLL